MTPPTADLAAALARLIAASTDDFVELVKICGLDPGQDFRNAILSGADLRDADLSEFDLTNAVLERTLLAGARLNETVDPQQLARASMTAPTKCYFVGRACTDAATDILAGLGPAFVPATATMTAIEALREARDRTLHLKSTRVRNQPAISEMELPSGVVDVDAAGSSFGLVLCDLRSIFDAAVLTRLLEALSALSLPFFAFVVTEALPMVGKAVRSEIDKLLSRYGPNLMVSVGGTPIVSRANFLHEIEAAQSDSVNLREMVSFLEAATRSYRTRKPTRATSAPTKRPPQVGSPAILMAVEVHPTRSLLDAIREAWLLNRPMRDAEHLRALILIDENFDRSVDINALSSAFSVSLIDVRAFARSQSQDGLYVLLADHDSHLWRLVNGTDRAEYSRVGGIGED